MTTCSKCDKEVPDNEDVFERHDGTDVCKECKAEMKECRDCSLLMATEDMVNIGTAYRPKNVCKTCREDYERCGDCGALSKAEDIREVSIDGDYYELCERCRDEMHCCNNCGDYTRNEYNCSNCDDECEYREQSLTPVRSEREIRRGPAAKNQLYLGWELETEAEGHSFNDATRIMSTDATIGYKPDGSLDNGIEFVSSPMTWAYLQDNREVLSNKLKKLSRLGFRSYETGTCGMHVHMSRAAFTQYHLYKFMRFIYGNKDFVKSISQRKQHDLDQWATLESEDSRSNTALMRKARVIDGWRYSAVNTTNRNTVEIRIFKGTLKPESFFKNLEFLASLYHYSKVSHISKLTTADYAAFIKSNKKEFPALFAWMVSKSYLEAPRQRQVA